MKIKFKLFLLFCMIAASLSAQKRRVPSLNIGASAPPLKIRKWVKGIPFKNFEKGNVYVLDFWATWCGPCRASMPYLSVLAHRYKNRVIFVGIDIWDDSVSIEQVKSFVNSMGQKMDFSVAVDDSNFMANHWVRASGLNGIPTDFIVNAEGRISWIGNPTNLDEVLVKIFNNTWDIKAAASRRVSNLIDNTYLRELDVKTSVSVSNKWRKLNDLERADSVLSAIKKIVKKEPKLKYTPAMAYIIFWALLVKKNYKGAYEYGKKVIKTSTYQGPAYTPIIHDIENRSHKSKLPDEIYQLGAEAYQAQSDNAVYPDLINVPEKYDKMATWYRLAGDTSKAREVKQKAINSKKVQ